MNILQLICSDNFIVVNKTLVSELGVEPALLLGELASEAIYWQNQEKTEDGYFYSTIENIEAKTTLTAYQQRKALEVLKDAGVVDVISKKGNPPKRYIKINEDAILQKFNFQKLKNLTFKSEKISLSKVKKLNIKNKRVKKNEKEENNHIELALQSSTFTTDEFKVALSDFLDMRKKIRKPATDRAVVLLIRKLTELSNGNEGLAIQILNQSTTNSWLGVYPLRNNYSYSSGKSGRNQFMEMLKEVEVSDFDEDQCNTDFGFTANGIPEHTD